MGDNEDTHDECLICLSQLQEYDVEFPLLCPSRCTNICYNCLSHLKTNQFGGGAKLSDNGRPACPKCRGDISATIQDTYTMRGVRRLTQCIAEGTPDSELSGAELRLKYSITPTDIENAKKRLENFKTSSATTTSRYTSKPISEQNDLMNKSNDFTTKTVEEDSNSSFDLAHLIDIPLLDGLESYMTKDEQVYITELLTSGDTLKLAQAAQILSEMKKINGVQESDSKSLFSEKRGKLSAAEERAIQMSLPQHALQQKKQLPCMPKHVVLKPDFDIYAAHRKVLKLKDDSWDGSIADGFARAYTMSSFDTSDNDDDDELYENEEGVFTNGHGGSVGMTRSSSRSIRKAKANRILVTASRRQAYSAGIRVGDCVTHVNMDEFVGTAEELKALINTFYLAGDPTMTFTLTLNAEQNTADALKQRMRR